MPKITQYRANFVTGYEEVAEEEYGSLEELLAIEWVHHFKLLRGDPDPTFYRFSKSMHEIEDKVIYTLMAEYREGKEWWVVGHTEKNDIIELLPDAEFKK